LLENFSEREMVFCQIVLEGPCRVPARRDRERLSPGIAQAFGGIAVYADLRLEKKYPLGQRVLDGLSGVRAGG
jgi:hypothetical protein